MKGALLIAGLGLGALVQGLGAQSPFSVGIDRCHRNA